MIRKYTDTQQVLLVGMRIKRNKPISYKGCMNGGGSGHETTTIILHLKRSTQNLRGTVR